MLERIRNFWNLTVDELVNKVSWPSWDQLRESTIIVVVASIALALVIYVMDVLLGTGLSQFYKLFR